MSDNYSDAPQSITEIRAERDGDMRIWSPRDVLVAALRSLDSGQINPDAMVIVYRDCHPDNSTSTSHFKACPDIQTALGMCHRAAHIIQRQWDGD